MMQVQKNKIDIQNLYIGIIHGFYECRFGFNYGQIMEDLKGGVAWINRTGINGF